MGLFNKKNTEAKKEADKKPEKKTVVKKSDNVKKDIGKVARAVDNKVAKAAYRVLIKPVISEKATIGASLNKYTFEVAGFSNKVQIKKAIEEAYGVIPVSVNIVNQKGKSVRFGRKFGRKSDTKKAIVTLKKGDSIKLYEGI
ncbi:50S ribosomal protein L23 [Patescibacteria group bacterium]|nr:50S ribosomal protein L23 [Patescibacteria group bacterium]